MNGTKLIRNKGVVNSMYVKTEQFEDGFIAVEVNDVDESTAVSSKKMDLEKFGNSIEDTACLAKQAIGAFSKLDVEEIEFEFGVKVGFELGVAFWAVSKATSESNFKVKIRWKRGVAKK